MNSLPQNPLVVRRPQGDYKVGLIGLWHDERRSWTFDFRVHSWWLDDPN